MSILKSTTAHYAILILSIFFSSLISVVVSDDDIQLSKNPNHPIETYTFQRDVSWSNRDFDVEKVGDKKNKIKVTFSLGNQFTGKFKFNIKTPKDDIRVKVNKGVVLCSFKQTYKLSNGVQLLFDPRGWNSDRWFIKKSGNINQKYTFHRAASTTRGYITAEDGRKVAYFDLKSYSSEELSRLTHEKTPGAKLHRIVTNCEIPIEVLLAMDISSILRIEKCNS